MTARFRLGKKMVAVLRYVEENPGCTKLAAGNDAWTRPHGRMGYRYGPVNRCVRAGLIRAVDAEGRGYALTLTAKGKAALEARDARRRP